MESKFYSKEVKELITYIPAWILKWARIIILLILSIFVMISILIKTPIIITKKIEIYSKNTYRNELYKTINCNDVIGFIILSEKECSKIKIGQEVNIELDNYPEKVFLVGKVKYIENGVLNVIIPSEIVSNYLIRVPNKIYGKASISINGRSVFNQIIERIYTYNKSILYNSRLCARVIIHFIDTTHKS